MCSSALVSEARAPSEFRADDERAGFNLSAPAGFNSLWTLVRHHYEHRGSVRRCRISRNDPATGPVVLNIGSLTRATRTPDETDAAIFWQGHLHAFMNRLMRNLAASQGLDSAASARLFAMANLAAADAAIGCWNDKYYWQFWRPISAIREADSDGNPATEADPTWWPLFHTTTQV